MLKFFYRLKRRRGVVLFAVISMMTVLIIMATVAYFTTRTAFQTVVSNYDFSQMYISTTAVSDMLLDSVIGETSLAGTKKDDSTDANLNYFTALKTKLDDLVSGKVSEIVGVSKNVDWSLVNDPDAIRRAGAANPIVPGALDAVKVRITLQKSDKDLDGKSLTTGLYNYYVLCETVGYYRDNAVSIQDYIYKTKGTTTTPSKNDPLFSTFFTATSQTLTYGVKDSTARAVVITTDEISDDAFFQNKFTIFMDGRSAHFKGGVRTTGGLYLNKMECDIPAPTVNADGTVTDRHDWIIGGDMVYGQNANINLNGNDLYVKGDLYICNANPIHAGSIYVEGNIYLMYSGSGSFDITGGTARVDSDKKPGLYVNGNITAAAASSILSSSSPWQDGKKSLVDIAAQIGYKRDGKTVVLNVTDATKEVAMTFADEFEIISQYTSQTAKAVNQWSQGSFSGTTSKADNAASINTDAKGESVVLYQTKGKTISGMNLSNTSKNADGTDKKDEDGNYLGAVVHELTWDTVKVQLAKPTDEGTEYGTDITTMSLKDALDKDSNNPNANLTTISYESYSVENVSSLPVLELDFSKVGNSVTTGDNIEIGDVNGAKAYIKYYRSSGQKTTEDNVGPSNCQYVEIELPYVKGGYLLKYAGLNSDKSLPHQQNGELNFYIHTPDGYQKDENGNDMVVTETVPVLDSDGNPVVDENGNVQMKTQNKKDDKGNDIKIRETMPIVLAANFFDGAQVPDPNNSSKTVDAPKDADGNNAFRWTAGETTNGYTVNVNLVSQNDKDKSANGYVVMEMGNYDSTGKYVTYDPANSATTYTTTYYTKEKEKVGTLNQLNNISKLQPSKTTESDQYKFLKTGTDDPMNTPIDYDNKLILVSNKNNAEKAVDMVNQNTTLCGYIYAPNGSLVSQGNSSLPVFGGLIVSDYTIDQSCYLYAQPDPSLIAALGNALKSPKNNGGGGSSTPSVTVNTDWIRIESSNYLG